MEHKHEPIEEVEDFFLALEEKIKKYRKYFEVLEILPQPTPANTNFTEYGNSSVSREERVNARLEPNLRRT